EPPTEKAPEAVIAKAAIATPEAQAEKKTDPAAPPENNEPSADYSNLFNKEAKAEMPDQYLADMLAKGDVNTLFNNLSLDTDPYLVPASTPSPVSNEAMPV